MVAITVILAAVIAAFVLGLGDTNAVAPNTSFDYDFSSADDNVQIRVAGGDSFDSEQVSIVGDTPEAGTVWTQLPSGPGSQTEVTAGASVNVDVDTSTSGTNSDYLLEIKWTSESGDTSSIISTNTGPDREAP
jgi:FlaG/FlaF family flagellin (archaellin)